MVGTAAAVGIGGLGTFGGGGDGGVGGIVGGIGGWAGLDGLVDEGAGLGFELGYFLTGEAVETDDEVFVEFVLDDGGVGFGLMEGTVVEGAVGGEAKEEEGPVLYGARIGGEVEV